MDPTLWKVRNGKSPSIYLVSCVAKQKQTTTKYPIMGLLQHSLVISQLYAIMLLLSNKHRLFMSRKMVSTWPLPMVSTPLSRVFATRMDIVSVLRMMLPVSRDWDFGNQTTNTCGTGDSIDSVESALSPWSIVNISRRLDVPKLAY